MTGGGVGGFTADDATAGVAASTGASTLDLYNLGDIGQSPVYFTDTGYNSSPRGAQGGSSRLAPKAPTYQFTNQQTSTAAASSFAAASQSNPSAYQQQQQELYAAGYYTNKPRLGVYSSDDSSAYRQALLDYQQVNGASGMMTFDAFLKQQATKIKASGGPGPTKAPLQVQLTDPTAIKATLQANAQDELGRNLNDKELNFFVNQFQGLQRTDQTAAYNDAGTVTPPDLSGQAAQYLISQHGPEHDQKQAAGFLDSLANKLGVLT